MATLLNSFLDRILDRSSARSSTRDAEASAALSDEGKYSTVNGRIVVNPSELVKGETVQRQIKALEKRYGSGAITK